MSARILALVLVTLSALVCLAEAAATPPPPTVVVPESTWKKSLRQTSRLEILARRKNKALKAQRRAERLEQKRVTRTQNLVPRASETPFPTCDTTGSNAIPYTGFTQIPGYYINRVAPYDVVGAFRGVTSNIACVMLCQESSSCVGTYWDSTANTCTFRQAIPSGSNYAARSATLGVMALKGDCSTLAPKINNATIMATCCNAPQQGTKNICTDATYRGFSAWTVSGQRTLTGNRITTAQGGAIVVSGTNNYGACLTACESYSSSHYPTTATNAGVGCVAAVYDQSKTIVPTYNCLLYSTALSTMTLTTNTGAVAFVKGNCAQRTANNVATGVCCDSS